MKRKFALLFLSSLMLVQFFVLQSSKLVEENVSAPLAEENVSVPVLPPVPSPRQFPSSSRSGWGQEDRRGLSSGSER
jgi:hypothetical protein